MTATAWLMLAGGALVLGVGIWLKRQQARFVAGLRAGGDPMADGPRDKQFRQRFQAWLFGMGDEAGPAPGRSFVTLVMAVAILGLAAWSLLPGTFG